MNSDPLSQKQGKKESPVLQDSPDILEIWIIEVIEELRSEGFSR